MTARLPLRIGLAIAALVLGTAIAPPPTASAGIPSDPPARQPAAPELDLIAQTPVVAPRGVFQMWIDTGTLPVDGSLELVVHGRIRSRSELTTSIEGIGLRSAIYRVTNALASVPLDADGSRRLAISLDPAAPNGLDIRQAGAYPVEVIARDVAGTVVASLISHLLVPPGDGDESPPLSVAVVVRSRGVPTLAPDGSTTGLARAIRGLPELGAALAASAAPVTWALSPETIDALGASPAPEHAALLETLRRGAAGERSVAMTYAPTSPDALLDAGLEPELAAHLRRGGEVLSSALDVTPAPVWLATDDLTADGVRSLARAGIEHLVVSSSQVEPLRPGVLSLSLAHPFLVGDSSGATLDAMALDPAIVDRVGTRASPGLETSRLLAELAMLWFEQPGIPRAAIVPIDPSVRPAVVTGLLEGLGGRRIFRAVPIGTVFEEARRLVQPGGRDVERPLVPAPSRSISTAVQQGAGALRASLPGLQQTLAPASATAASVEAHLLLSTSTALRDDVQAQHLDAARSIVTDVVDQISAPARETITLTAREGTIPLTLRNDTGEPVSVVVRLRSPKLEFPGGSTIPVVLTEAVTRLDIGVRVRASGAFPLEVEITSPDGSMSLATVDYSIQSTAVSGVGVVLSAGAALFLLIWWGRHWSRTRRSAKLVATTHPAVRGPDGTPPAQ